MFYRKPIEERIADRVARRPPLKEGKTFEHKPALIVFCVVLALIALKLVGVFVLYASGLH
ncbi:hypothetical protein J5X84_26845 [Streptosporangiaceae bacterium NEAU-GS5]|nr:hypothetical protein [Streptosporangiaceae bacterium NEAU-GS5]